MRGMAPGTQVSGYELVRAIGRGSRAVVWEARVVKTGEPVALKILDTLADAAPERLKAEFIAQSRIEHPNVVSVHGLVEIDGKLSLVAELVKGIDLREYIQRFKPNREQAIHLFGGILRGLSAAHALGLIHRDLKPNNILMPEGPHSTPKILDFGVVKMADSVNITQKGMLLGTLRYMPPEQLRDPSGVDVRADLFAAGCILFELLTHQKMFDAPNKVALMNVVRLGQHTPFPDDIDPELKALVLELTATDPEDRPASADVVLERLGLSPEPSLRETVPLILTPPPAPASLPWAWIIGIALPLGLIAALLAIWMLRGG